MAPKRPTPMEEPPSASSSSEEEEEQQQTSSEEQEQEASSEEEEKEEASSEEEEGEEKEEPKTQTQTQTHTQTQKPKPKLSSPPPQTLTSKPSPPKKPHSESESESESESGSDSESEGPIKPIASKPMQETPQKTSVTTTTTTKPRSKLSTTATTVKSSAEKRVSETDRDPKDAKRAKKKEDGAGTVVEKSEDTKKQLFQRLWSEDDEIAVLKGLIDFKAKKGIDPAKDMNSFYEFIKKSLHFDVALNQLKDKVWRLKKKYEKNSTKGGDKEKKFSKPHEQKSYDLSNKIWGGSGNDKNSDGGGVELSVGNVKSNGKAKKSVKNSNDNSTKGNGKSLAALKVELGMDTEKEREEVEKMEVEVERGEDFKAGAVKFVRNVGFADMEEYVVKRGLEMLEGEKKAEMEEKWRKLHVAELELFLKRNELVMEQAKLMLAAYKSKED